MSSRKKKKNWFITLNQRVKEYQVLISIIIGIIGLLALYFTFISNRQAKEQEELDEIKNITLETVYTSSGVELLKVVFHPMSDEILIKSYEIILPSDFKDEIKKKEFGDVWNTYTFCEGLLSTSLEYIDIEPLEQTIAGPDRYSTCYPLAIKFNYIYKGKEKEALNIYKAHFLIFENSVIRIKAFELLHNNETLSENKIVRKLDDINQKECLGFSYPLKDNLEQDFNKLNKFYKLLFQNVESSLRYITRRTIVMDGNNKIDSLSVTVTMMVGDTAQNKVFLSNLFFLIENIDSLHSDFHPLIRRVERFIFEHPFCKQVDYSCLSKSDWNNNEVKKEWQVLNKELLKQFGVYLESQIQKYKKIKGE